MSGYTGPRGIRLLVAWLRERNGEVGNPSRHVSFHGLDLYSLSASATAVISYLAKRCTSLFRHIQIGKRRNAGSARSPPGGRWRT